MRVSYYYVVLVRVKECLIYFPSCIFFVELSGWMLRLWCPPLRGLWSNDSDYYRCIIYAGSTSGFIHIWCTSCVSPSYTEQCMRIEGVILWGLRYRSFPVSLIFPKWEGFTISTNPTKMFRKKTFHLEANNRRLFTRIQTIWEAFQVLTEWNSY